MDQLRIDEYTITALPDGRLVVSHPRLAAPVELSRAVLLRLLRTAVRQSFDSVREIAA